MPVDLASIQKKRTCEHCKHGVVFDRSLSPRDLSNLGCGFTSEGLLKILKEKGIPFKIPETHPDATCQYWTTKEEEYDGNQESILHLVHPFGAE